MFLVFYCVLLMCIKIYEYSCITYIFIYDFRGGLNERKPFLSRVLCAIAEYCNFLLYIITA